MTPGRFLIVAGIVLLMIGLVVQFAPWLRLGRLPGDLSFGGQNWRIYIPIGTSILLSIILTAALATFNYFASRR